MKFLLSLRNVHKNLRLLRTLRSLGVRSGLLIDSTPEKLLLQLAGEVLACIRPSEQRSLTEPFCVFVLLSVLVTRTKSDFRVLPPPLVIMMVEELQQEVVRWEGRPARAAGSLRHMT